MISRSINLIGMDKAIDWSLIDLGNTLRGVANGIGIVGRKKDVSIETSRTVDIQWVGSEVPIPTLLLNVAIPGTLIAPLLK